MSQFAALNAALSKAVGQNDEEATVKHWLSTGFLPLNHALSGRYNDGGLPSGRIIEIFGPSSAGKTAIATKAMISAQTMGGFAGFVDHERSFSGLLGEQLGLNRSEQWLYKKPNTFEDSISLYGKSVDVIRNSKLIEPDAPICWVVDSLASMIPAALWERMKAGEAHNNMKDKLELAACTSTYFKELALLAEESNTCLIFLNQIRMKPGVIYGDPMTTPGGESPKFYASLRLQLGATKIMKGKGDDQVMIGQEVSGRTIKNKTYRPFMRAKWKFMFREDGSGFFDEVGSLVDFVVAKKILDQAGAYIVWNGKKFHRDPLVEAIRQSPQARQTLEDLVVGKNLEADHDEEAERDAKAAGLDESDDED